MFSKEDVFCKGRIKKLNTDLETNPPPWGFGGPGSQPRSPRTPRPQRQLLARDSSPADSPSTTPAQSSFSIKIKPALINKCIPIVKPRLVAGKEEPLPCSKTISLPVGEGGPRWREGEAASDCIPHGRRRGVTAPWQGDLGPGAAAAVPLIVPRARCTPAPTRGI